MAPKEIASKGAGSDFARIAFTMFLAEASFFQSGERIQTFLTALMK
jgi:hypothetical protein